MNRLFIAFIFLSAFISCQQKSDETQTDADSTMTNIAQPVDATGSDIVSNVIPSKTYVKEGNVFVVYTNAEEKKLTFLGQDSHPFLLKSKGKVVFVRKASASRDVEYKHIMMVDIADLEEEAIATKKPYRDGRDGTYQILDIDNPVLSEDESTLYFVSERYAVSSALIALNLQTKEWKEISPANYFYVVKKGKYKGYFAISTNEIRNMGRAAYLSLIDTQGKVIRDFADNDDLQVFLATGKGGTSTKLGVMHIKAIILKAFPSRKYNGKNWDNSFGGTFPDIYIEYALNKTTASGNPDTRVENVSVNDLPIEFPVDCRLYSQGEEVEFMLKDYDSVSGNDEIARFFIRMKDYTRQDVRSSFQERGVDVEIVWEWKDR